MVDVARQDDRPIKRVGKVYLNPEDQKPLGKYPVGYDDETGSLFAHNGQDRALVFRQKKGLRRGSYLLAYSKDAEMLQNKPQQNAS